MRNSDSHRVIPISATLIPPAIVAADVPHKVGTIGGQPHALPATSATWYRFGYGADPSTGKGPIVTTPLLMGKDGGVRLGLGGVT